MSLADWLFDRRRTCADCSLYERQADCLRDALVTTEGQANELIAALMRERDGLRRELKMERMRLAELRPREGWRSGHPAHGG